MIILDVIYHPLTIKKDWKAYFSKSKIGQVYKCLINNKGELIMSNTEVEIETNQVILKKAFGDVLLIGLGINLINDQVLDLESVNSTDTVENNKWIINNVPTKTNLLIGNYQTYKYTKKYDVIWFDAYDSLDQKLLKKLLKPKGKLLTWAIN